MYMKNELGTRAEFSVIIQQPITIEKNAAELSQRHLPLPPASLLLHLRDPKPTKFTAMNLDPFRDDGLDRLRGALRQHYFNAAAKIQAPWRSIIVRRRLKDQKAAAGKIQTIARTMLARKRSVRPRDCRSSAPLDVTGRNAMSGAEMTT